MLFCSLVLTDTSSVSYQLYWGCQYKHGLTQWKTIMKSLHANSFPQGKLLLTFSLFYRTAGCSQWHPAPPLALTILIHGILQYKETLYFWRVCSSYWGLHNCLYRGKLKTVVTHFYNIKSRYTIHDNSWKIK